ncbi:MAG: hypothetical protein ACI9F9_000493 [Candidatus Paceibacteria bacterium]|jgi:uncharacterized protein (TIGR01777 family)
MQDEFQGAQAKLDLLISGSSGLVGGALSQVLANGGHRVRRLVRSDPKGPDQFLWNTQAGTIDPQALDGVDCVIHLAGENIAGGRWGEARKRELVNSRVQGTQQLVAAIRENKHKPESFLCASAIGIYGSCGDRVLDEASAHGTDFLSHLCEDWEQEALALEGVRTVCLRFGVILSAAGGALQKMLLPFRLGLGGRIGDGKQWMSWVALEDAIAALERASLDGQVRGPINVVAPNPVTNAEFTRALGRALSRPTMFPMPAFVVRTLFGEMGDALLLASQRVQPRALQAAGFEFQYPGIDAALRRQLER